MKSYRNNFVFYINGLYCVCNRFMPQTLNIIYNIAIINLRYNKENVKIEKMKIRIFTLIILHNILFSFVKLTILLPDVLPVH